LRIFLAVVNGNIFVPPMGYIDIEVPFTKPENVGEYVFHCHILEHEDAGMMGKVVVKP
jgi:FtsP/CotA-like multicopper oxidase with cupredoxin domain